MKHSTLLLRTPVATAIATLVLLVGCESSGPSGDSYSSYDPFYHGSSYSSFYGSSYYGYGGYYPPSTVVVRPPGGGGGGGASTLPAMPAARRR